MNRIVKGLSLEHVKDYVQIGVGLSFISGGVITVAALFGGGDDAPATADAPPQTPAVSVTTEALPSSTAVTATVVASATVEAVPTDTPAPTQAPAARGEFLRVQFGTEQDPLTLLPDGDTVGPDQDIEVCPGDILYTWVEHTFRDGDVITGRLSNRTGTLYSDSVPVDERAPNFWLGVQISEAGIHTVKVSLEDGGIEESWSVNVTCGP